VSKLNACSPEPLFLPKSVAILGASDRPGSWPNIIRQNLTLHGFQGEIYPVNPKYTELWGGPCFSSIKDIPDEVDQIVALIPNRAILPALKEAARKSCRSAIIVSGGFRESETVEGASLEDELSAFAREHSIAVCGPNCVGLLSVATNYLPTTYNVPKEKAPVHGGISLVSQSGGFLGNLLQSATDRGIGFRTLVSSGNEAGLDLCDYIDYFLDDPDTRVVGVFIEGIKRPEKFFEVALKARKLRKPIVAMKLGRSEKGQAAALSHTGSMTGSDEVFDAVFRKLGIIRVEEPDQLLETLALFHDAPLPQGEGVGVITNSGGLRGMVFDTAERGKIKLAALSPATVAGLNEFLSVGSVVDNPLDGGWGIVSSDDNYRRAVELLLQDPEVHLLAMQGKLPEEARPKTAERYRIAAELSQKYQKPLMFFSIFSYGVNEAGRAFRERCPVPFLHGLDKSFQAVQSMTQYAAKIPAVSSIERTMTPSKHQAAAKKLLNGKKVLTEIEAKELLKLYGILCTEEALATTTEEAIEIAEKIGFPVALKVVSKEITHKTDAGGVKLGVNNRKEVEREFNELLQRVKNKHAQAVIEGVLVQEMVAEGVEVILGIQKDPQFGPVILFGMGGVFVELLKDAALRLAPLTVAEAQELIREIKGYPLLSGFRGSLPCDIPALAKTLLGLSQLAVDLKDDLVSIDINPLKVLPAGKGAKVVDALVVARSDHYEKK